MKKPNNKYVVRYKNKTTIINRSLVESRNISESILDMIKGKHRTRLKLIEAMENTNSPSELVSLVTQITNIDFELQELWGFPEDETMHRWFDVPKCTCPKLDNEDALGSSFRYTDDHCPVHLAKNLWEECSKIEKEENK